jgi:hypothetical protein
MARTSPHDYRLGRPDDLFVAIWIHKRLFEQGWKAEAQLIQAIHEQRMACIRMHHSGNRDVVVVGTVLPWRGDKTYPDNVGYCEALAAQADDWRRLWGDRQAALCVAGDFNQSLPHQGRYGYAEAADLLDGTLKSLNDMRCLTGYDKDPRPRVDKDKPSIDHICISEGFEAGELQCWPCWKDPWHAGVCAELALT